MVYLEDLDLTPTTSEDVASWAAWLGKRLWPNDETWQTMLQERFCIVPDDLMNFLASTATETIARIRMESKTKTVADGGLWYEEALPAESVLVGLAVATKVTEAKISEEDIIATLDTLTKDAMQLGGKATVGRGLCRVLVTQ